jgi:hypothetical protein
MKYDQGDKIDFGWKWAGPAAREAVAAYNAALESGELFQIVEAFNAQPITVKSTFDSQMFSVKYIDPYSAEYTQHFQSVSPSPFKPADTSNMGLIQIKYKGYNPLDTPALFPIVHDENWGNANTYTINRLGNQLYNIEALYAFPDDMWLILDKTKFPGIEDVTTVEDFVRIVGADSVNVEFVA